MSRRDKSCSTGYTRALHAKRVAQERITLAQHLRSGCGVVQLMVEVIPRNELAAVS
jgi:hypothetical protein